MTFLGCNQKIYHIFCDCSPSHHFNLPHWYPFWGPRLNLRAAVACSLVLFVAVYKLTGRRRILPLSSHLLATPFRPSVLTPFGDRVLVYGA